MTGSPPIPRSVRPDGQIRGAVLASPASGQPGGPTVAKIGWQQSIVHQPPSLRILGLISIAVSTTRLTMNRTNARHHQNRPTSRKGMRLMTPCLQGCSNIQGPIDLAAHCAPNEVGRARQPICGHGMVDRLSYSPRHRALWGAHHVCVPCSDGSPSDWPAPGPCVTAVLSWHLPGLAKPSRPSRRE